MGVVYANQIIWYVENGSARITLNTIAVTRSCASFAEMTYSLNHFIWTESGNPATIFKVGNEERNVYGYTVAAQNKDAAGAVTTGGEVTTSAT